MDNSKQNQTELQYACGAGTASVNPYTGRLLFAHADMSIGANTFQIGVSHIYNSQFEQLFPDMLPRMGNGWKLNVQQYLYHNPQADEYTYVDGAGYKHTFVFYKSTTSVDPTAPGIVVTHYFYHDTSGLNLTLERTSSSAQDTLPIISDEAGNLLDFDVSGRLVFSRSGVNLTISKQYRYNSAGQLVEIYDTRTPTQKITLDYDEQSGLLKTISAPVSAGTVLSLDYCYDADDNLIRIERRAGGVTEPAARFFYVDGVMTHAVDALDNSALRFGYTSFSSTNQRISNIQTGIATVQDNVTVTTSELYLGEVFLGDDVYLGEQRHETVNPAVDFTEKTHATLFYNALTGGDRSTTVTNEKGIAIEYFFNANGFTTGILERRNGSPNDLMTLTKDSGLHLITSDAGTKINRAGTVAFSHTNYGLPVTDIQTYLSEKKNKGVRHYVVSFWAKLNGTQSADVRARIQAKLIRKRLSYEPLLGYVWKTIAEPEPYSTVTLDRTATQVWQYITIPIELVTYAAGANPVFGDNYQQSLTEMSLSFEGLNGNIEISNLRLAPGQSSGMKIGDMSLDRVAHILYGNINPYNPITETKPIGSNFFMTESDVVQTYRNMAYKTGDTFDLIVCNGTKRITNVNLVQVDQIDALRAFDTTFTVSSDGTANYQYRYESPDAKIRTETSFRYVSSGITQTTKTYQDNVEKSVETTTVDRYGKLLEKTDEYGVKTTYCYDAFGNPEKAEVQHTSGGEKLLYAYTYDNNGQPLLREYVTKSESNTIAAHAEYNRPFGTLANSQKSGGWQTHYTYNAFNRLTDVHLKDGSVTKGSNAIGYDNKGRINHLSNGSTHRFTFGYNAFGDITAYNLDNIGSQDAPLKMMEKVYDYDNNAVTEKIYTDNLAPFSQITSTSDRYGNPESIADHTNGMTTLFGYQDLDESPAVAKVREIIDPYDEQTYTYTYDDENRPCRYRSARLDVRQLTANKTQYTFGGDNFETEIGYEEKLLAPRIGKTKHQLQSNSPSNIPYEYDYFYDDLGRLGNREDEKGKKLSFEYSSGHNRWDVTHNVNPTYKPQSNLIHKLDFDALSRDYDSNGIANQWYDRRELHFDYTYTYDERGNVTQVDETGEPWADTGISSPFSAYTRTTVYGYDGGDKVETEDNPAFGFNRRYVYNNRGQLTQIRNCTANSETAFRSFSYDSYGRLSLAGNTEYTHNNYGNTASIGGQSLTWTRGRYLSAYNGNTYAYNHQGVRFKKVANSVTTTYYLDGSKILGEDRSANKLRYFYDASGLCGFTYNGTHYFYVKDALGNITKILNIDTVIAQYVYDAFGNCKVLDKDGADITNPGGSDIGNLNPFRWKSFYLDAETGFLYMNTPTGYRYYDPTIGRFLSPDYATLDPLNPIGGLDPYGLCSAFGVANPLQVPANYANIGTSLPLTAEDDSGGSRKTVTWKEILLGIGIVVGVALAVAMPATGFAYGIGKAGLVGATAAASSTSFAVSVGTSAFIGGVAAGGINLASQSMRYGAINYGELAIGTAVGGISGAFGGSNLGIGWQIGINAGLGGASYIGVQLARGEEITWGGAIASTVFGGIGGAIGGSGTLRSVGSQAFWRAMAPGSKHFLNEFNKALVRNLVSGTLRGAVWSGTNDWLMYLLSEYLGW